MLRTKKALLLVAVFLLSGMMTQAKSYLQGTTPKCSDLCALLKQEGSKVAACSLAADVRAWASGIGVEPSQTDAFLSQYLWQEAWESMRSSFIGKSIKLNLWISYMHPVGGGRQAMPADARRLCSACGARKFGKQDKDNSSLRFEMYKAGYTSYNIIRPTVGCVLTLPDEGTRFAEESGRGGQWEWIDGLQRDCNSAMECGFRILSSADDGFTEAPLLSQKDVPVSDRFFVAGMGECDALTGCIAAMRVTGELNSSLRNIVTTPDASGVGLTDRQQMHGLADRTI